MTLQAKSTSDIDSTAIVTYKEMLGELEISHGKNGGLTGYYKTYRSKSFWHKLFINVLPCFPY